MGDSLLERKLATDRVAWARDASGGPVVEVLLPLNWADHVASLLADRFISSPDLVVCLPTGQTPIPVYDRLPAAMRTRGASASRATIVLLDDYVGLPPGHPCRSAEVLRTTVVDRLSPPPSRFIPFDVDGPSLADACRRFDADVAAAGGLDLVVLGLGSNGHIGVNEPGSGADSATRVVALADSTREAAQRCGVDPPPTHGVTLGMAGILRAPEVWLLVTGSAKSATLARSLEGPMTDALPASLLQGHPRVSVIADAAAAASLRGSGVADD